MGLQFKIPVSNGTLGHSVPTGFIAERLVFLRVTVSNEQGEVVFESGDLDPNGDLRDSHSLYVHHGELDRDTQLFSLQSKFVTRNIRGSEREQVLAVNHSLDALPFVRPATSATMLTGRPGGARIHRKSIPVGGEHWAHYSVPAALLTGPGKYSVHVELVAGMVPVNLIDAVKNVGFDYNMSARQVAEAVVAGHLVLWEREAQLQIE